MSDKEYSRPATVDDLRSIVIALNKNNAPYILIGGYALFAHGYHRATEDIDILVPASLEAGKSVKNALMVLPDQAAKGLEDDWFVEGDKIRLAEWWLIYCLTLAVKHMRVFNLISRK